MTGETTIMQRVQEGEQSVASNANQPGAMRVGRQGEQIVSQLNGRYYELARHGRLFSAHANVTAPVIYTTAAGTGGPLLWNGSANVNAVLLAVTIGISVVTTVAAALGITGGSGQSAAPTATTAIDSRANLKIGGAASQATPYRIGTPAAAGSFFLPFANLHTGALTVDNLGSVWVDLGGAIVVPPQSWASVAASATATTTVAHIGLVWAEVPV